MSELNFIKRNLIKAGVVSVMATSVLGFASSGAQAVTVNHCADRSAQQQAKQNSGSGWQTVTPEQGPQTLSGGGETTGGAYTDNGGPAGSIGGGC